MSKSHEILGVPRDASPEQIRDAYRGLVRRYHPDAHTQSSDILRRQAQKKMLAVNEAWEDIGPHSEVTKARDLLERRLRAREERYRRWDEAERVYRMQQDALEVIVNLDAAAATSGRSARA